MTPSFVRKKPQKAVQECRGRRASFSNAQAGALLFRMTTGSLRSWIKLYEKQAVRPTRFSKRPLSRQFTVSNGSRPVRSVVG
jgi:hypothetical protein